MSSYLLGICGGSASGKTFLLHQLMAQLPPDAVTLVSQDNYYKRLEEQVRDEDGLVNFDHPDSVSLTRLHDDIRRLLAGETLSVEEYTFNNVAARPRQIVMRPAPILILEGLFIFNKPELAQLIDLKVFVEAEEHIRLSRRLRRDTAERGYSMESILRDYEKFVSPMYRRHILPFRDQCDLIIPNNRHMYKAIEALVNHLRVKLADFSA
jgi:uridine kinase